MDYGPPPSFWRVLDLWIKLRVECFGIVKIVLESVKKMLDSECTVRGKLI